MGFLSSLLLASKNTITAPLSLVHDVLYVRKHLKEGTDILHHTVGAVKTVASHLTDAVVSLTKLKFF
mgnify:CR=1 FL=1|jgi:hypothetical protein